VFPIPSRISRYQYSCGREYSWIHIGAALKSSFSGLKFSFQILTYNPTKLKKYGPPWNILSRSFARLKMAMKNLLDASLRSTFPLVFQLVLIHHWRAFYTGQRPMNLQMRVWSSLANFRSFGYTLRGLCIFCQHMMWFLLAFPLEELVVLLLPLGLGFQV